MRLGTYTTLATCPFASLAGTVWDKYIHDVPFDDASTKGKRGVAEFLIGVWSRAILTGTEHQSLNEHDLVMTTLRSSTSAQAALAVGSSNTVDLATDVPADDAGDGVIGGMCIADDNAEDDEDSPQDDCSDDSSSS